MSKEIKLEAGQWYRTLANQIVKCIHVHPNRGYLLVFKDGSCGYYPPDQAKEHLPDCTGFDWEPPKPKLQLREGAWYKRKDGNIVGPCEPCDVSTTASTGGKARWRIGSLWYGDDGTCPVESNWLVHEVDAPKPKYRPFANAEEFKPHRNKWWKYKDAGDVFWPPACYSDEGHGDTDWDYCFENQVFEDGTPFGVRVDE